MKQESRQNPFAGMRSIRPLPELRERVLRASETVLVSEDPPPSVWDRMWSSRGLRIAWSLAVGLLVLGHVAVDTRSRAPGRTARGSVAAFDRDPELDEILRLERIEISPRAEAIALGRRDSGRSDS